MSSTEYRKYQTQIVLIAWDKNVDIKFNERTCSFKSVQTKIAEHFKSQNTEKILKALLCKNGALGFCLYTHMQKQYRDPRKFF